MIALSAEYGLPDQLAWATTLRGWAMAEQGHHEEGIAQMQEGLAASRATGAELWRLYFLCLLAEACRETGCLDDGLSALMEARAAADEHENCSYEAEIHRLKGELLLRRQAEPSGAEQTSLRGAPGIVEPNTAEAQSCFERAIENARKQSAKSMELRATMSLTRLLAKQGHRDEARAMLAEIYNWFIEGFDTADLKDAKALLAELIG
jgi:predicted ATPase